MRLPYKFRISAKMRQARRGKCPTVARTQRRWQFRIVLRAALGITQREGEMIKGSQLVGRAVIDMEAAERLGKIKEIIVQRDGERVAGFVIVHGETMVGTGGKRRMIPASAVYSIGPDAMTVRGSAMQELAELDNLPRMSDIIGHKMITQSGRLLGVIDDMLINRADGTIVGFVVGEGVRNKLENIFNPQRSRVHGYVRADANLHVGKELIVVPDDALIEGDPGAHEGDQKSPLTKNDEADVHPWEERALAEPTRPSIWTRRTDTRASAQPEPPAEPLLKTETARPVENYRAAEEARRESSQPDRENEAVATVPKEQS
jgi:uncharacterized protein YrrD